MKHAIAIVGMGCCYPDANSPAELWQNALAGRRAFRRIPTERLRLEDYFATDEHAEDRIYASQGAFISDYEFDRVRFRVAGSTYRSADLAHWLALDVAARALRDAGYADGAGLPREAAGVFLGNTLTGEFSRANALRLRWPYVRRVAEATLSEQGVLAPDERRDFLTNFEDAYKQPFPSVGAETLAGGLSNTIAGRICNHFDFKGGGYTVDGACASSLLAVANACSALVAGDLDVALAGGVDLSIDPFELVGFAKAGALAKDEMRVYDRRAAGFWPGEGCGVVVLMRLEEARAETRRIYAVINGWGVSSDGSAGITRPEAEGQMLALRRAYVRAGYGIDTVAYFEGHGTGTSVGDTTELQALSEARCQADPNAPPAAISSVKANIGHTKAAAGVAGLLKASMAVYTQLLPPAAGCVQPHAELTTPRPALRVLRKGERWPHGQALRAGVSAMGFGGINAHVTLAAADATRRRRTISLRESTLLSSAQDAELFLLAAPDRDDLRARVTHLLTYAARLSRAELTDLAITLGKTRADEAYAPAPPWRAAIVAATPAELADRLAVLAQWLNETARDGGAEMTGSNKFDVQAGVFLGVGGAARVGFLFPGQAAPVYLNGGALARRFDFLDELYVRAQLPATGDTCSTTLAQPAIVAASLAGLRVLNKLGVEACVAVGHSLGELTALHWAGALDESALLRLAALRARAMVDAGGPTGKMISIKARRAEIETLLNGDPIVISGFNSPEQLVVAGEVAAVDKFAARVRACGHAAVSLNVAHAFHSPLMSAAVPLLARGLGGEELARLRGSVISTVTGALLPPEEDLRALLCRQLTAPVRFADAATVAAEEVDLFIEVGPGLILGHLVGEFLAKPCVSLDAGGESLQGLLKAVGAVFAASAGVDLSALFAGRYAKPFALDWRPGFFVNPCELAPVVEGATEHGESIAADDVRAVEPSAHVAQASTAHETAKPTNETALELVRRLVAERAELPPSAVQDEHRLLADLHLNSITVGQLVVEAARSLGLSPPLAPTEYAHATVAEMAGALGKLNASETDSVAVEQHPPGVSTWVRSFTVELIEQPLRGRPAPAFDGGGWRVLPPAGYALASPLQAAFARVGGSGVVVCLPPDADERHVGLLLAGARAIAADESTTHFVLVQHGRGAASFARTLQLEMPQLNVCVVNVPMKHPRAVEWVLAETAAANGYTEAHYDAAGSRRVPVLRLLPRAGEPCPAPLSPADVILVTGGGKGIAAECAFALARQTGASLALLGRAQPDEDAELAANLERMTGANLRFRYFAADVTDADAVRDAIAQAAAELGDVTAVIHGAGVNTPRALSALDEATFLATLRPKVQGMRHVLAAIKPEGLRLLVTFGSIIARTGMRGEADYAVANEWLTDLTAAWGAAHPHCRCLAVEWSVWAGVGMGQRLGSVDALLRQGIMPIPTDEGVRMLQQLLNRPLAAQSVVVTGRFGTPPTLQVEQRPLPLLRFLEESKVYYPGLELIVEARLSADTDPYLGDHVFQGEQLFPAVMGLEAMAQAAQALAGAANPPSFAEVKFERPVAVPVNGTTTIRLAALARETGEIEVVLRSEQTAFQVDHFRAVCCFEAVRANGAATTADSLRAEATATELLPLILEPGRDLYGTVLFHRGRFQRVRSYRRLTSTECVAEIERDGTTTWFGRFVPGELLLGDPGRRDATIHAIQACVPSATILPVGVKQLAIAARQTTDDCFIHARERAHEGHTFTYDVEVTGTDGRLWERWEGLKLQVVNGTAFQGRWAGSLLGPYLERRVRELIPGSTISVAVEPGAADAERQLRSDRAIRRLLGPSVRFTRRPGGKLELASNQHVSVSHTDNLTLVVADRQPLACDVETVTVRPSALWRDLLGQERFALAAVIAHQTSESLDVAATRVWTAVESLKKAGVADAAPLTLASVADDAWVMLAAPPYLALTYPATLIDVEDKLIFSVLARNAAC